MGAAGESRRHGLLVIGQEVVSHFFLSVQEIKIKIKYLVRAEIPKKKIFEVLSTAVYRRLHQRTTAV